MEKDETEARIREVCLQQAGLWSLMAKEAKTPEEKAYCEKRKNYYWNIYTYGIHMADVPRET